MKEFRSICFIYAKEDAYETCYLKEFFKWIGFSYLDCLHDQKSFSLQRLKKSMFDIIVNINSALPSYEEQEFEQILNPCFVELSVNNSLEANVILRGLLEAISKLLKFESCNYRLLRLSEIFEKYRLVEVLYEYNSVLWEKIGGVGYGAAYEQFSGALNELEELLDEGVDEDNIFTEYVLYAKFVCQKEINDLMQRQKKMLCFDVEEYLKSINEIYFYDEDFFKAEYLKAKVAQQDYLYDAFSVYYLESCIAQCANDLCRSYHYYTLAKWKEKQGQLAEAGRVYRLSYYNNPMNIKAVFKVAVEAKRLGNKEMAIDYLEQITDIWNDQDEICMMPLSEVEYGYKTRMLLSLLKDRQFREQYENAANRYLRFVQDLKEDKDIPGDCFAKRMFRSQEQIVRICDAMLDRMDQSCFNGF